VRPRLQSGAFGRPLNFTVRRPGSAQMVTIGLTAAGAFLGMVLVPLLLRWAVLVHTTFKLHGGDFLGAPKRRLLWAAPFVLLLHPALYFVAVLVVLSISAVRGRISEGWLWVTVGFCAYSLFIGMFTALTVMKVRKRARTARNA